jgi:RND superfamily putative drug exporter
VVTKLIGVGMAFGILLDATLIRALLVPATMRLLGRWNWWAPGPLGRLHRRTGQDAPVTAPGRSRQAGEGSRPGLSAGWL